MPLNLASPGVILREVDVTIGRIDATSNSVAAIVAPFEKGPVETSVLVQNEQELLSNFGQPRNVGNHYENWFTASSFLAYGGKLLVLRSDDTDLKNANYSTAGLSTDIKIKSYDDYINKGYDDTSISNVVFASRNPGSWANGLTVAFIDAKADQTLSGISTSSIAVGYGVTHSINGTVSAGVGTTTTLTGYIKGIVTNIGVSSVDVKIISYVANGTETTVDYQPQGVYKFASSGIVGISTNTSTFAGITTTTYASSPDWYDAQTITLNNGSINWNTIAPRPGTSRFSDSRGARFDEIHVAVIDGNGSVSGNAGTILEKHVALSKAKNAIYAAGSSSYWSKYISTTSALIFAGSEPVGTTTCGFASGKNWNTNAENNTQFKCVGSVTASLTGGKNYDGGTDLDASTSLSTTLTDLSSGYDLLTNREQYSFNFLLMGSASYDKETAQALASKIISVAEQRQDAIAFISPYKNGLLNLSGTATYTPVNSSTITDNIVSFYSSIPSSSYAVFDSGYKYMYDKFAKTFRYIPLNGDIAGICAKNDTTNAPWVSPAGTSRGAILNAVKLAYNPSKSQRDKLYSNRVNPVIFSPGSGIILFGDKTGLSKASAFDRINIRRLFIYVEKAIRTVADDQLFEFNDETTRNNFLNAVEPFLRDIQAKRGIIDYRVICDTSNNTAAIIDNNEFVADIYIKPSRSINYIGLTFVATRSGVSFNEVVGNV